jgi:hypothetical protein
MYEKNIEQKDRISLRRYLKQTLDTTRGGNELRTKCRDDIEDLKGKEDLGKRQKPKGCYNILGMEDLEKPKNKSDYTGHVTYLHYLDEMVYYKKPLSKPIVEYNLGLIKVLKDTTNQ